MTLDLSSHPEDAKLRPTYVTVDLARLRSNLEAIHLRNPELYRRIVLNMLGHLSGLLRMTSAILRDTSESVE